MNLKQPPSNDFTEVSAADKSQESASVSQASLGLLSEEIHCVLTETFQLYGVANASPGTTADRPRPPDILTVDVTTFSETGPQNQNDVPIKAITADERDSDNTPLSTLISRDIELTTTIDILAVCDVSFRPFFSFFLHTPYDGVNWRHMKLDIVELGISHTAIASAISAVSALYQGQLYSLPLSKAVTLYHSAKCAYEKLLDDETQDFSTVLAAVFLLCLFDVVHYETAPILKEPSEVFTNRLASWSQHKLQFSPLSSRIITWLRLLHATTVRGGGMGLISDSIFSLLPDCRAGIANLRLPSHYWPDASSQIYDMLSTPIFEFYYQLQGISSQIARLTHYHRSRTTGVDQEEVAQQIADIKSRLHDLWESRSATQRQTTQELRLCLASHIANSIIRLIGVCTAAYHAEFVEMDRVLRDPASESTHSKQARCQIRKIIDGNWNAYDGGKLNPGYLRPLFLCAIECMDRDECRWAVDRLERIKNPICRSEFFASFGTALSDAQLQKGRRVTSKYFCIWRFGISPPFM